jgi:hypothetical protein
MMRDEDVAIAVESGRRRGKPSGFHNGTEIRVLVGLQLIDSQVCNFHENSFVTISLFLIS